MYLDWQQSSFMIFLKGIRQTTTLVKLVYHQEPINLVPKSCIKTFMATAAQELFITKGNAHLVQNISYYYYLQLTDVTNVHVLYSTSKAVAKIQISPLPPS